MQGICLEIMTKNMRYLDEKILANGNYAISSLIYMQPIESMKIMLEKEKFEKIIKGMQKFPIQKSVVESSCCLISNITYNCDEAKAALQTYKLIPVLCMIFDKNVELENS